MAQTLQRVLYFHGGPGFNGNPERHLLAAPFAGMGFDLRAWDEPSTLRPNGFPFSEKNAFQNYLERAEEFLARNDEGTPLILVGHSFGSFPVSHLVKTHPGQIALAVYIAPDLALPVTDRNMFEFTLRDFKRHDDERFKILENVLQRYSGKFDANAEEGFNCIVQNPRLFDFYWEDKSKMAAFLANYSAPSFGIDMTSCFAVRRSLHEIDLDGSTVPAAAIFGALERVVSPRAELAILNRQYQDLAVFEIPGAGHYPHVEQPARVLEILRAKADSCMGSSRQQAQPGARPQDSKQLS